MSTFLRNVIALVAALIRRPNRKDSSRGYGYKFTRPAPEPCQPCIDLYGKDAVYAEWAKR